MPPTPAEILEQIAAEVRACTKCRLCQSRKNAVPGEGGLASGLMFIGEGPGFHENEQGRPFVGQAGMLLEELLASIGLKREQVFITNVVKCRPPDNRDPLPDEIEACASFLDRQIAAINPRLIVSLGRYSMAKFFPGKKISEVHGQARFADGRAYVAMYHPAAGLRAESVRRLLFEDFKKLPVIARQLKQSQSAPSAPNPASPSAPEDPPPSKQLSLF